MNVESMTAGQVMSRVLVAVKPDESPLMAWELMRGAGVPVLSGGLIGLITARDVLSAVAGRTGASDGPGEVVTGMFHLEPVLPPRNEPVLPTRSWGEA